MDRPRRRGHHPREDHGVRPAGRPPGLRRQDPDAVWLGNPDFHLSHRSRLLAKDPRFYTEVFPGTDPDLEYVWPEPKHELLPEDPAGDRMWVLRLPLGDTDPRAAGHHQPAAGRAARPRPPPGDDDYQFVYADNGSRRPDKNARKRPAKPLVKKPTRKRQAAGRGLHHPARASPSSPIPFDGGASFAVGEVLGRPITVDGPLRAQLPGQRDPGPLGTSTTRPCCRIRGSSSRSRRGSRGRGRPGGPYARGRRLLADWPV